MGSKPFKILEDSDGKKYIFNDEAFDIAIKNKVRITKKKEDKKITQISIIETIADLSGVTIGAVKNWKQGKNGPSDIEMIKHCAQILNIDYHILLTPLNKPEEKMLKKQDVETIVLIYEKLVAIVYDIKRRRSEEIVLERNNQIPYRVKVNEIIKQNIEQLHLLVDQKSLLIDEQIKYKLHRLIFEMLDVLEFGIPLRWENMCYEVDETGTIVDYDEHALNMYSCSLDRLQGVKNQGLWYIEDEISLGKRLGITDFKEVAEELLDQVDYDGIPRFDDGTYMQPEQMVSYGLNSFSYDLSNADFEITPPIVFLDTMSRILKRIFEMEFPGIKTL